MKILIATDGSEHARAAAERCRELISPDSDLQIKIISAIETLKTDGGEPFGIPHEYYLKVDAGAKKRAAENVEETEKIFRDMPAGADLKIETEVIFGYPKEVIVEEAEKWGADLIIIGSHGYGFWERMLLGSVSDAVLHHAPCSVLVVRKSENADG